MRQIERWLGMKDRSGIEEARKDINKRDDRYYFKPSGVIRFTSEGTW
jgi:hypothetical protein